MLPAASSHANAGFFDLYDKYSPFLFGVLIKLTGSASASESILVESFEKFYRTQDIALYSHCMQAHLLKFTVDIAYKRQFSPEVFLERFNKLPLLYRLMIGNIDGKQFEQQPSVNHPEYGKKIAAALQQVINETTLLPVEGNN